MSNAIRAVQHGFSAVHTNSKALSEALFWPVVAFLVLTVVQLILGSGSPLSVGLGLVGMIPMTVIAVRVHRIIVLGADSVAGDESGWFGRREVRFLVNEFLIVLFLIPLLLLIFIPALGPLLFMLIGAYIVGRVSLVFPSLAIDRPIGFMDSWQTTAGHGLMMLVVVGILPGFFELISFGLRFIPGASYVLALTPPIIAVYMIACLSAAYQILADENQILDREAD